jgi:signal transduction histidine kinase
VYPAFIAEMGSEAARPRLQFGIWSGYLIVATFGAFAVVAWATGLIDPVWPLAGLVGIKVVTNTLAWLALRVGRGVLEIHGLNTTTDCVLMTCAIYLTGGMESPLTPIYVIEISVVALLSNLGVTLLVAAEITALFTAMSVMLYTGTLPHQPTPFALAGGLTRGYLVVGLLFSAFVVGVPTVFTALILRILRRKERALEARTEALIDAGRHRSQFMVNITHELRTPIHGISGLSELIESGVYGPVTAKQAAALQQLRRSARGLLQMIDDLLEMARHDAGKLEVRPADVDLAEVLPAAVASTRWMLGAHKQLEVTTELAASLPPLRTDRGKLAQIVINLVANACKFTPEGGHVVVSAHPAGADQVAIAVSDDGPGIPAAEQGRIFDEFRQVDGSMERHYGGAGLGLPLVKRLVGLLGGSIAVDSEIGRGSTFTVTLPTRIPPAAEPAVTR